jgi:type IV pilus assembly protein PilV
MNLLIPSKMKRPHHFECHYLRGAKRSKFSGQSGATLIEVLVAVLLLSFGIVGLAGLQYNGSKFNHSAYLRSQAVSLAYDFTDRVRSNLNACQSGGACAYVTPLATPFDGTPAQACGLPVALVADANAMAAFDVNQWKSCVEAALPAGQGQAVLLAAADAFNDQCGVNYPAAGREVLVVEVNWADGRLQAGANPRDCVVVRTEVRPL